MRLTAFYYLAYPDTNPPDELIALSEVYVEVSEGEGDVDHFDSTHSIFVHTIGYLQARLTHGGYCLTGPALIVERFDDTVIKAAITASLLEIVKIAGRK